MKPWLHLKLLWLPPPPVIRAPEMSSVGSQRQQDCSHKWKELLTSSRPGSPNTGCVLSRQVTFTMDSPCLLIHLFFRRVPSEYLLCARYCWCGDRAVNMTKPYSLQTSKDDRKVNGQWWHNVRSVNIGGVATKALAGDPASPRAARKYPREVLHKLRPKGQWKSVWWKVIVVGLGSSSLMEQLAKSWRWKTACNIRAGRRVCRYPYSRGFMKTSTGLQHGPLRGSLSISSASIGAPCLSWSAQERPVVHGLPSPPASSKISLHHFWKVRFLLTRPEYCQGTVSGAGWG